MSAVPPIATALCRLRTSPPRQTPRLHTTLKTLATTQAYFWNYSARTFGTTVPRFTLVSAMAHRQIIVLRNHGKWVVRSHRKEKPFETKEAALKARVDIAHQSGKNGEPAQVMLCDTTHAEAQVFWTYGEDAYPPSIKSPEAASGQYRARDRE
jgi:hypothetical protein